jgi:hypothetical protein
VVEFGPMVFRTHPTTPIECKVEMINPEVVRRHRVFTVELVGVFAYVFWSGALNRTTHGMELQ